MTEKQICHWPVLETGIHSFWDRYERGEIFLGVRSVLSLTMLCVTNACVCCLPRKVNNTLLSLREENILIYGIIGG